MNRLRSQALALCLLICMATVQGGALAAIGAERSRTISSIATNGTAYTYTLNSLTSGIGMKWSSSSATTGTMLDVSATALTTGTLLKLTGDDDALTTGKYIDCKGDNNATTSVWSVAQGGSQAIVLTNDAVTAAADGLSIDASTLSGAAADALQLKVVSGTMSNDARIIRCLDGTSVVFAVDEGGIITGKGGATIDNATSATVLNLTETTVRVTGALDVTGGLTTDTNAFAIADTTGVVTMKGGATIDNNAAADTLAITETKISVAGALDVTGGFTTDTNAFAVADTTGVVTMKGGTTLDNNAAADTLTITETNIGLTGTTTVTGALTTTGTIGSAALKVPLIAAAVTDYDAQAATLTIAGLRGGFVTQNSKTGASTATTPTGTEISAGISGVAVGHSFSCVYYNRGDQTSTITAGASGVTIYGTAGIATLKTAVLYFICTAENTWSCYVVAGA